MIYPFPIKIPVGAHLDLAQAFRADTALDLSTALSKSTLFHNGVDVTCGTPQQTWGRECVWPFPFQGVVYDAQVDRPLGATQHAHSQIDGTDPVTGTQYSLIYIHLSAVTKSKDPDDTKHITYAQGETIGRIGNNGFVNPTPTSMHPLDGSHLHLGVGVKKAGASNFTMVDPLLYFDITQPYYISATHYTFNTNLVFGGFSQDISDLQKVLQQEGCFPATAQATGYYGPITASAVLAFRLKYGVSSANDPLGHNVGPLTRATLNMRSN